MDQAVFKFFTEKFGNRVDHPQPIISNDDIVIADQLAQVNKRISNTRLAAILFIVAGALLFILTIFLIYTTIESESMIVFNLLFGVFNLVSGFVNMHQRSSLERKKAILEAMLFLNVQHNAPKSSS